ncbi:MAG: hypothetical protein DMG27_21360 [Acidobacteria bacterium]|nr:MAG: hypothetical protein DMG27_21360 [Acidobacteriota bacterium]
MGQRPCVLFCSCRTAAPSAGGPVRCSAVLYLLKRHPIPIKAFFRHSLVLTYAFPESLLEPLMPPGLVLDTYEGFGFVAIAMVQTQRLRPVFVPQALGQDFFLTGYRIFARFEPAAGRKLRGLRILRSDVNRRLMVWVGNLLTHYKYRKASVALREGREMLDIEIKTPSSPTLPAAPRPSRMALPFGSLVTRGSLRAPYRLHSTMRKRRIQSW